MSVLVAPVVSMLVEPAALVSPFENRRVEPLPVLLPSAASVRSYPGRFERYFGDNFGFRSILTWIDHWTRAVLLRASPVSTVMIGRGGWLYFLGEDGRSLDRNLRGVEAVPDSEIDALRAELVRRRDYLTTLGIGYIVTIVPEKFSIYPEYLPPWVARAPRTRLDRVADLLTATPGINFVDLRPALIEAKARKRVYYMTDSHWNYLGATVAYGELMQEVQRIVPGAPTAPPAQPAFIAGADYYSGDLAAMLALPRNFREDDVAPLAKILADPKSRCAQADSPDLNAPVQTYVYRCPNPPARTAVVYRDSMAIPLIPMLSENFARITYVSSRKLDRKLIERLHPDVVMEESVERAIDAWAEYPM